MGLKPNQNSIKKDFIIVGQGLAGSVLAVKLIRCGYKVLVIDKPELSKCSKVAAGIWNPVVFKRITKSWLVDDLFPEMLNFYTSLEKELNQSFIQHRNIIKLFSEQQEADLWIKKAASEMKSYIESTQHTNEPIKGITISQAGFSKVIKAGNLNLGLFLKCVREYLEEHDSFSNEQFSFSSLKVDDKISYKNFEANKLIFAEGYLIKNNPFFNCIPFKPAKGEVITIASEAIELEQDIVNKNGFIMPLGRHEFKVGATYNWEELNEMTSEAGLAELISKLHKITPEKYQIIEHEGGVRPSVIDRRPVLGAHPRNKNLIVFNGLGTKGVMLAPYFAEHLVNHLVNHEDLNPEVNVARFNHFFVN